MACLSFGALAQSLNSRASGESGDIVAMMDDGHWKHVRQIVDARLRSEPNSARWLYLSSKVWASFGNLDRALATAERAVEAGPRNPDYLSQLAEIHARLADHVSVIKQVMYVRAFKKEVETALAVEPKHVDTLLVDIMFLSKAPMVAGGDRKRAHALARELAQVSPTWGNLIQARLGEQEKDDPQVERALLGSIAAKPGFYPAHFYLGKFYCCVSATHRLDAAEKQAREMIRLDPTQSGGYDILARVLVLGQRWAELEAHLAEAEAKVPEDLSPYYQAAQLLVEQGRDFPRAERYLKKYLSQEPEGRQPTLAECRHLLAAVTGKNRKGIEASF